MIGDNNANNEKDVDVADEKERFNYVQYLQVLHLFYVWLIPI
jgi:hypothetical protein